MNLRSLLSLICVVLLSVEMEAQSVSISQDASDPHASAILDLQSNELGFLIPRMSSAEREAIASPATGLLVFDTNTRSFWVFNSIVWVDLAVVRTLSDLDGDTRLSVEATPDEDVIRMYLEGTQALVIHRNAHGAVISEPLDAGHSTIYGMEAGANNTSLLGVSGDDNTLIGYRAGYNNTTGRFNTFLGSQSGQSNTMGNQNTATGFLALHSNTSGDQNSAFGVQSLFGNLSGGSNTASGFQSLYANTTGDLNSAFGYLALQNNDEGSENVAIGARALSANTTGSLNTAAGYQSMYLNSDGFQNTALGAQSLYHNTGGIRNTAIGFQSLYTNTGNANTAVGFQALNNNTTGTPNTAVGFRALRQNTTGTFNSALGHEALHGGTTGNSNTAMGYQALNAITTHSFNTAMGSGAGSLFSSAGSTYLGYDARPGNNGYSNTVAIGYPARSVASNQIRLGNSNIVSIGGFEDWTNFSDGRYKHEVRQDVLGLDFILQLRPVTYALDVHALASDLGEVVPEGASPDFVEDILISRDAKSAMRYSGFIAQEVEMAANALGFEFSGIDTPDNGEDFYGLRYATFVVPLVKAVQELSQQNADLQSQLQSISSELHAVKNALLDQQEFNK